VVIGFRTYTYKNGGTFWYVTVNNVQFKGPYFSQGEVEAAIGRIKKGEAP
jgi:hypothetical protein